MNVTPGIAAIEEATEKLSNWNRWGKEDEIGTLNLVSPDDIVAAAKLIRKGKVFAMGLPLDKNGPQKGSFDGPPRWNPIHTMLATGTDGLAGRYDEKPKVRYADDAINMPIQCATHWDALGHVFWGDTMYNGFSAALVDSQGVHKNGIEHTRDRMVGRGVLLDVARFKGVDDLENGYAITNEELDACAKAQGVEIRKGDFVLIRTGHMERVRKAGDWGTYAGGDAPGVAFENCYWCHDKDIAAICTDTWGVETRPNRTTETAQPWHQVVIPAMGLTMGEMFDLSELAADCAEDGVYEFFFCGPPLIITRGTGSPINPQAIK